MESSLSLVVTPPLKQPRVNSCANSEPSICVIKPSLHLPPTFPFLSQQSWWAGGQGGEVESFPIDFRGGCEGFSLNIHFSLLLLCLPVLQGLKS